MRIHRNVHRRAYTVVSNSVLQDNQLSFVARGVLGYLLSLRDGTQVDVRKLAKLCTTGRDQIAGALNELKARGYYGVERIQDADTGRWVTRTVVRESPEAEAEPESQVAPAAGMPDAGGTGRPPEGEKTGGKVPPSPVGEVDMTAAAAGERPPSQLALSDAALIRRIGQADARLRIGEAEAAALVPLIAQWRARGVGDAALVHAVTVGLPDPVFAPVKFLLSRLTRKLPPAPPPVRAAALTECEDCGRPMGADAAGGGGRCAPCARPTVEGEQPWAVIAQRGRARVRAALAGAGNVSAQVTGAL